MRRCVQLAKLITPRENLFRGSRLAKQSSTSPVHFVFLVPIQLNGQRVFPGARKANLEESACLPDPALGYLLFVKAKFDG